MKISFSFSFLIEVVEEVLERGGGIIPCLEMDDLIRRLILLDFNVEDLVANR